MQVRRDLSMTKLIHTKYTRFKDKELWNLETTIACFVLPRLKRFRKNLSGHPCDLTFQEWKDIMDEMIYAMEFYATGEACNWPHAEGIKERVDKGMEYFAKYFGHLWD